MPLKFKNMAMQRQFSRLQITPETAPGQYGLTFSGALSVDDFAEIDKYLSAFFNQPTLPHKIIFDVSGLDYLDSDGAFLLYKYNQTAKAHDLDLSISGFKDEHQRIYKLLKPELLNKPPLIAESRKNNFLVELGTSTYNKIAQSRQIIEYVGTVIYQGLHLLLQPRRLRWADMLHQMHQVGVGGLPIVGLIGLLMGMILAFMSIVQLQDFGASIYVAALVSLAMVKELGPIMTAVVVAGRSGSAFAAEIGSMKENEELDALSVMGYDPVMFLAMPRVIATVLVVPLLFIFSCTFGILGGLMVGTLGMGLNISSYLNYTVMSLDTSDFVISIVKSMVFAFLIATVGCQRGFAVRGGASAVGQATTSSVVISIFIVIVIDSIFAIVQQYAWWW